jgi:peptidyl-prolyl cis-trans isomerase C
MQAHRGKWGYLLAGLVIVALISAVSFAVAAEKKSSNENTALSATGGETVATVNGVAITRAEFDREMDGIKQQFQAMGQPMADKRMAKIQEDILENLISTELLYQAAEKQGVEVEQKEVDQKLASLKERFPKAEDFDGVLKKMQMTEGELKSHLKKGMIIQHFIDEQIIQKISIPDEEVKAYYDKNPALFTQPERVRASHILIKVDKSADETQKAVTRKKIEEIQQKLKNGDDFAALAKEFSQCPSSSKGGDLGYFHRGQMVAPFEEAAFALKPGETSDIVETQFGYHIIKVVDKQEAQVKSFEDVKDRLAQYLKQEKAQNEVKQYLQKLKADAEIERHLSSTVDESVKSAEAPAMPAEK